MLIEDLGKRPLIMGIINVTPDSFSGDGVMTGRDHIDAAVVLAERMIAHGAAILDIGGESSRPGAEPISGDEEIRRIEPVIAAIKKIHGAVPLAIDTVKAPVAKAALDAGATIINDISGLRHDPMMAALAAQRGCYVVLMHNRSERMTILHDDKIGGQYQAPAYGDIINDVVRDLAAPIEMARIAGVADHKIIIDPGLGFGKTVEQNLALINHLDQIKGSLRYPVMIGPSRKSFIGRVLDKPVEGRLQGTAACVATAILRGADIIRVHDVKEMVQIATMTMAIKAN